MTTKATKPSKPTAKLPVKGTTFKTNPVTPVVVPTAADALKSCETLRDELQQKVQHLETQLTQLQSQLDAHMENCKTYLSKLQAIPVMAPPTPSPYPPNKIWCTTNTTAPEAKPVAKQPWSYLDKASKPTDSQQAPIPHGTGIGNWNRPLR